jgi:hypothetical protein
MNGRPAAFAERRRKALTERASARHGLMSQNLPAAPDAEGKTKTRMPSNRLDCSP